MKPEVYFSQFSNKITLYTKIYVWGGKIIIKCLQSFSSFLRPSKEGGCQVISFDLMNRVLDTDVK